MGNRMWFHLSKDKTELSLPITQLERPRFDYQDVRADELVLCIAPTVWQCLLSISSHKPKRTTHYIFEIFVMNPTSVEVVDVWDASITYEHRITPDVLIANGGKIETKFIGTLRITTEETLEVKFAAIQNNVRPDAEQECTVLWHVDENGDWKLREGGANIEKYWKSLPK